MFKRPTNDTPFTPEQYDSSWSRDELTARYIHLCIQYGSLRTQISRAGSAHPFERERAIHNLLNARLRLQSANQRLHRLNQALQHANQTNSNAHGHVQKRLADTEATLRAVLEARPQGRGGELRAYQEGVAVLEEENERLRKQLQNWTKSGNESADDASELGNAEEKWGPGLDEIEKRMRRLASLNSD